MRIIIVVITTLLVVVSLCFYRSQYTENGNSTPIERSIDTSPETEVQNYLHTSLILEKTSVDNFVEKARQKGYSEQEIADEINRKELATALRDYEKYRSMNIQTPDYDSNSVSLSDNINDQLQQQKNKNQAECQQKISEYNTCLVEYNAKMAQHSSCLAGEGISDYCPKPINLCHKPTCY